MSRCAQVIGWSTILFCALLSPDAIGQTASCFSRPLEPWNVVPCCYFWQGCFKGCAQTVSHHTAEDVDAAAGTPVKAAADGVLRHAQTRTAFGGVVILEHQLPSGEILTTLYGHLEPATLPVKTIGSRVSRGDVIGYIGTRETNGGYVPHLHFGINKGAFSEGADACGGSWRYAGYTNCAQEQTRWYAPSEFMASKACTGSTCGADQFPHVPSAAAAMSSNAPLHGECISHSGDLDWFLFFGETGQIITLRAYPASGSSWPVQLGLKRWAATDAEIDATNETTTSYAVPNEARITNYALTRTGRFYIKIRGNGSATGPYVFEKQNVFRDAGSAGSPLAIAVPFVRNEFIDRALEEDWYQFTLTAARRVRIEITNQNAQTYSEIGRPLQMQAALFQSGTRLSGATESEGNAVLDTQLAAGTYQLKVRAHDTQVGYYRVSVTTP